jgi:hypothetical protein
MPSLRLSMIKTSKIIINYDTVYIHQLSPNSVISHSVVLVRDSNPAIPNAGVRYIG